jgi:hypothetical protein
MTKAELVARLPELADIRARLAANEAERNALRDEWEELRQVEWRLGEVDEVFEGVPIRAYGSTNLQFHELGDDGEHRSAYVNPYYRDEDEGWDEPDGYLLSLSGAERGSVEREWRRYKDRGTAVAAAKRFVAHGVVPLPDVIVGAKE